MAQRTLASTSAWNVASHGSGHCICLTVWRHQPLWLSSAVRSFCPSLIWSGGAGSLGCHHLYTFCRSALGASPLRTALASLVHHGSSCTACAGAHTCGRLIPLRGALGAVGRIHLSSTSAPMRAASHADVSASHCASGLARAWHQASPWAGSEKWRQVAASWFRAVLAHVKPEDHLSLSSHQ